MRWQAAESLPGRDRRQAHDEPGSADEIAMQVPSITKITLNMGVGEAVADKKVNGQRRRRPDRDRRPEAGGDEVAQVDRGVQAARRRAGRPQGDAARRPHVRVPGPPDQRGDAAHPRLPRRVGRARSTAAATTTFGVKEQIIFPEIAYDQVDAIRGMDITITTTRRRPTRKAGRCSNPSTSRSASRTGKMAKTSMIMREKRREKLVKQYAAKRAQLKEAIRNPKSTDDRAGGGAAEAEFPAARFQCLAGAQPLRDHRPLPWRLPQVRARAAASCAKRRCAVTSRASARPAGKPGTGVTA